MLLKIIFKLNKFRKQLPIDSLNVRTMLWIIVQLLIFFNSNICLQSAHQRIFKFLFIVVDVHTKQKGNVNTLTLGLLVGKAIPQSYKSLTMFLLDLIIKTDELVLFEFITDIYLRSNVQSTKRTAYSCWSLRTYCGKFST